MGEQVIGFGVWMDLLRGRHERGERLEAHELALLDAGAGSKGEAVAILFAEPRPTARRDTCSECERAHAAALRAGQLEPPVSDGEIFTTPDGGSYRAGLCRYHTDLEWSRRWQARFEKTGGDESKRSALREQANKRALTGRKIYATGWHPPAHPAYPARTG